MSEMIERVAKAIAKIEQPDRDYISFNKFGKEYYCSLAKAAIEAMREPTKAMVSAGYDEADGSHLWREVWKAMIDEALK